MSGNGIETENILHEVDLLHQRAKALHASLDDEAQIDPAELRDELSGILKECSDGLSAASRQFHTEIERRRRSEQELRRERDRVSKYLDITGSIVVVLDREGTVVLVNQTGCEMLACEENNIVGKNWFDNFIPRDEREATRAGFDQLIIGKVEDMAQFENRVLSCGRGERLVAWRNALVYDENDAIAGTLSSGEDITDRRRMETTLRESERLDAVGALAETVSQNFGNILRAIDGYASFLVDSLISDTRAHRQAQRIVDATRHASELIRRLMHVAKANAGVSSEMQAVPLEDVVRRTLDLLDHVFVPRNVKAVIRPDTFPSVEADFDQLMDVLMSILTNSAEAMPKGGEIRIDTIERRIMKPRVNPKAKGGVFVGLRIRDTGVGMSRTVLKHIFEPLYTTKANAQSLGLGLPLAQSIIKSMGGWIDVRSREGTGTVFRLFLRKETVRRSAPVVVQAQSILVVDDSSAEMLLMQSALQDSGYTVFSAADPTTALRSFRERSEEISVAVVDLLMTTSDGVALAEQMLSAGRDVAIMVTSGFSREYARTHLSSSSWTFVQKPYSAEQFVDAVNRVLQQRLQA